MGVFQAHGGERKGYTRGAPLIALAPRVRAAFHSACVKNAGKKKRPVLDARRNLEKGDCSV